MLNPTLKKKKIKFKNNTKYKVAESVAIINPY